MSNLTSSVTCKFFVQRKKRYCKMLVKSGCDYCGEHQKTTTPSEQPSDNFPDIRIVCPLDPKHTVYATKLSKHLKICNARPKNLESYIVKNINSGLSEVPSELSINESYQLLSNFPSEQILLTIKKVNDIFKETAITITDNKLSFPVVEEEMNKPEYGDKAKKHFTQASAILGLLEQYGMFQDKTCYIEFGAGRGQLSCWIAEATKSLNDCKILLIEKASPKHKRDNKLAKTTDKMQRIRADIADLVLDKLDCINDANKVVGVTKHLCGAATDLAIRCLTNPEINKDKIFGMVLTFCCHHRCLWTPYTGKEIFEQNQLNADEFNIICGLSSWATCGTGFSREYRKTLKNEGINEFGQTVKYGLNRGEREEIGRKCKYIINWGRLKYLEKLNFDCSLHYYVDKEITLENVCIVAVKNVKS